MERLGSREYKVGKNLTRKAKAKRKKKVVAGLGKLQAWARRSGRPKQILRP